MRKKLCLFGLLLALCLCLFAFANKQVVNAANFDDITFEAWNETTSLPVEGNYYLTADVNIVASLDRYINAGKELNLDLRGHNIIHSGNDEMAYYVVYYLNGGTLSIYDSVGNGTISGANVCGIWATDGSIINLYGGTITGNNANASFGNERGGIYLEGGATLNMYGGAITGNANGARDVSSRGRLNFYAGHIGDILVYFDAEGISFNGGYSEALIIDSADIHYNNIYEMKNGKLADGSIVKVSMESSMSGTVVTSGYTAQGYEDADEVFEFVPWNNTYEIYGEINNDGEVKVVKANPHTHSGEYAEPKAATCLEAGNLEYYYCSGCNKYFSDANCENEVDYDDLVIAIADHQIEFVGARQATCTQKGCVDHYECTSCHKCFSDEALTNELSNDDVFTPVADHNPGTPKYVWSEDYTECYAELRCSDCHSGITGETVTVTIDKNSKTIEAVFTKTVFENQVIDNPFYEGSNCGMHWVLLVLALLFIGFYACWYTFLGKKEFKFLPAKIAKALVPLFVCALMFVFVLIFGIIGMAKGCGACIAFFIIDVLLIAAGVALYFFEAIVINFFGKLFKKEKKDEEDQNKEKAE